LREKKSVVQATNLNSLIRLQPFRSFNHPLVTKIFNLEIILAQLVPYYRPSLELELENSVNSRIWSIASSRSVTPFSAQFSALLTTLLLVLSPRNWKLINLEVIFSQAVPFYQPSLELELKNSKNLKILSKPNPLGLQHIIQHPIVAPKKKLSPPKMLLKPVKFVLKTLPLAFNVLYYI
jgi:hypothetical protein